MTIERQERVQEVRDGDYARRQRVVETTPDTRSVVVSRVTQLLWLITAIIVGLITFRFGLKLIGANPVNGFVSVMYSITDFFVGPFNTIVGTPAFNNGSILDTASLFAIVVYLLAAWGLVTLFRILFAPSGGTRRVSTFERDQ
jgi:uncharacterized protein YggT (Ycf19 family)